MRVITGEYKGRKLETPVGRDIRPTSDKVKESIFNILMNDTWGRVFCDLFCGTGGLGIEALSRGAGKCYFCDSSRDSIRLTRQNIAHCGADEKAVVFQSDYSRALKRISEKVDVFLLDPPYHDGIYVDCITQIQALDLLADDGIILAEHDARSALPEEIGELERVRVFRYGKTSLSMYRGKEEQAAE